MIGQLRGYLLSVADYVKNALDHVQKAQPLTIAQTNDIQGLNQLIIQFERCLRNEGTLKTSLQQHYSEDPLIKPYYDYLRDVCLYMKEQQRVVESGRAGVVSPEQLAEMTALVQLTDVLHEVVTRPPSPVIPPIPVAPPPLVQPSEILSQEAFGNPEMTTGEESTSQSMAMPEGEIFEASKAKDRPAWAKLLSAASTILFYVVLVALVVVFVLVGDGGASREPANVAGFSFMTVLTGSMEGDRPDSIPRQSLVVLRHRDPNDLEVGMVATYVRERGTTLTHRIVEIIEDHEGTGERAFRLQGDANATMDRYTVLADDMLGEIVWQSLALGRVIYFVQAVPLLSGLFVLLLMLLIPTAKKYFQVRKELKQELEQDRLGINQVQQQ